MKTHIFILQAPRQQYLNLAPCNTIREASLKKDFYQSFILLKLPCYTKTY
jgi:hypothetical protein